MGGQNGVGIVPPSVVHTPPSYLYFMTTLSPSLPESVWSPPSGDRPPTKEWVLVGVADSSQLGSLQGMREKMVNMQQRAIREVEAGRQALQEAQSQQALNMAQLEASQIAYQKLKQSAQQSLQGARELQQSLLTSEQSLHATQQSLQRTQTDKQALEGALEESQFRERALQKRVTTAEQSTQALGQRVQDAEARARDLQTQLEASQGACQELQQSLLTSEQSLQTTQQSLQMIQTDKQALEGALQESQTQVRALQERVTTPEQEAREQVQLLQQRVQEAEQRAEEAERRARVAQQRARERHGERNPSWLVHREEINLTEEEVGRGGWGVVKVATFRGARIAAKCLYGALNYGYWQNVFSREMNMAACIRHPNLLQFIGATLHGELIILTELMPTSLRAVLERAREPLPQQQISTIGLDIARALNYLHLMRPTPLIHRDVSSANVLLEPQPNDSWKAKVSDYGSVNLLENLRTVGPGSPVYAAPEANIPPLQSPKMDIFSFGVLLVEMCTARFPDVADREDLIQSIQKPDMVALIRRCLAENRDERPSASDIITEF